MTPDMPTLPSLPTSLAPVSIGPRAMVDHFRWVPAFPYGPKQHRRINEDGAEVVFDYVVGDEFIGLLTGYLDDEFAAEYYPPVACQHQENGLTYGLVVMYRLSAYGLDLGVVFAEGMAALFDRGYLDKWSPTFRVGWQHPTSKIEYPISLKELSFVTVGQFKDLPVASAHYKNSEQPLAPPKEPQVADKENMDPEEIKNMDPEETPEEVESMESPEMADVMQKLDMIAEALSEVVKYIGKDDDAEEVESGEDYENSEVAQLQARIATLELQNAEKRVTIAVPGAASAEVAKLAGLLVSNSEAGEVALSYAIKAAQSTGDAPRIIRNAEEVGKPGAASAGATYSSVVEAAKAAKAKGVPYGLELSKHLRSQGFEVANCEPSESKDIKTLYKIPV